MKKYIKPVVVVIKVDSESLMNTGSLETLELGEAVEAGSARSKKAVLDWDE